MINGHTVRALVTMGLPCPASATASVQASLTLPPLPRAPAAHAVTITPPGQTGSEPAIALNPYSPNQVVAPAGDSGRGGGDVSLTFDDKGSVFLSFLSIQKNGLPGYWGHGPGGNGIWVRRSPDGGRTWDRAPVAVKAWSGDEPDVKLEDMPRIWADAEPHSPHRGNLYIAWIEWQLTQSIILFSRSRDGGRTWATPQRI